MQIVKPIELVSSGPNPDISQSVSGTLKNKDLKKLTRKARSGGVGPTVIYYAGVTAPIISAAVAMMVTNAAIMAGLSEYWQWFSSAMVAAFAGISWYLIFIRWSYRHTHGRGNELDLETGIALDADGVSIKRGVISTHVGWAALADVNVSRGDITIYFDGADPLIIPKKWFGGDKDRRMRFIDALHDHME